MFPELRAFIYASGVQMMVPSTGSNELRPALPRNGFGMPKAGRRCTMNLATFSVCSVATLIGCTTPESRQRDAIIQYRAQLEAEARQTTVDPSDGISEVEAYKIGRDRFDTYRTACGSVSTPVDLGNYWRVTLYFGVAATPVEEILIRKSDGLTTIKKMELPKTSSK